MSESRDRLDRRKFLSVGGAAAGVAAWTSLRAEESPPKANRKPFAFVVAGDTHYCADRAAPGRMSGPSAEVCGGLVDAINALPGKAIPAEAGGGAAAEIRGVVHAGDVIDSGDRVGGAAETMQATEWSAFVADWGLDGKDGRLKAPVYEIAGNHDAPHGKGLALEKMIERNRKRTGVSNVSENGVQYSWDWEDVHFVNLGLIVGSDGTTARKRRYAALDSLAFLVADLKAKVGGSGRPVVVTHHVDVARYTGPCDSAAELPTREWDPCDVAAYYKALAGYNVAGVFYGHTHARRVFRWDGLSAKAAAGVPVFNTDNASHFASDAQAFLYVEIDARRMLVREYQTTDRWKSGFFTPESWSVPLGG